MVEIRYFDSRLNIFFTSRIWINDSPFFFSVTFFFAHAGRVQEKFQGGKPRKVQEINNRSEVVHRTSTNETTGTNEAMVELWTGELY